MARLLIHLLGPFEVVLDGQPATGFRSDKARALLAYLCVEAATPHRRERLAGLLWPDLPEQAARTNLRHALANVRQVIADQQATPAFLVITRQTVQFGTGGEAWVDALAFLDVLETTERPIPQVEETTTWYRGEFLEGFSLPDSEIFGEWLLLQRERFQRLYLEALEWLVEGYTEQGEYERALGYAWRQVELDPLRENAHRQLMRLLAYTGRAAEALRQYEACRRLLKEELGVEPSIETTGLCEQIRNGKPEVSPRSVPSRPPHNLPAPLTPFVGREMEMAETQALLQGPACRLLTLVGPGGIGKTRLALEVGRREGEQYAHGVYLANLADLQSAEAIVPTIAVALGFCLHEKAEPKQQLVDYLRGKKILLILDSFEHLLSPSVSAENHEYGGGVGLVLDILKAAPGVTLLVTSRARLNLRGEQIYPVGGLNLPESDVTEEIAATQYDAVQLFVSGARRVHPGFQLKGHEIHVTRICQLLQGMPLGILLAASWSAILTPAEIAARLSGGADGQEPTLDLSFLETDWHDLPRRQRSIRAVFDHSWGLLAEREREICQKLSVFRGFSQDAAEKVTGASLRELKALADRSLLHRVSATRYEIHELVRQYAAGNLRRADRGEQPSADWESVHDQYSAYYAVALQQWGIDLRGPRQQATLSEMELDSENIRAAWQWAVKQGQVERLVQAIEGLALFYWLRGRYNEGEAAMQAAVSALAAEASRLSTTSSDSLRLWIRALVWRSDFCRRLGRREQVVQLHQQAKALLEGSGPAGQTLGAGQPQDFRFERALLLLSMGRADLMSDHERGRQLHEESLALFRRLDEKWRMARALDTLGRAASYAGSPGEARQHFAESLALCQDTGDELGSAQSMANLSQVALYEGNLEEAEQLARKATDILRQRGSRSDLPLGLSVLGYALEGAGRFGAARAVVDEALAIHTELGQRHYLAYSLEALSRIHLHLGQYEQAQAHAETGLARAREADIKFAAGHALSVLGCVALARGACAEAQIRLQESAAVYQEMGGYRDDLSEAHSLLACAARGQANYGVAREHLAEALVLARRSGSPLPLRWALAVLALLLADEGEAERAVELYALASHFPFVSKSCWFQEVIGREISDIAATLPPDARAAVEERGTAQDLEATAEGLLTELQA